MRISIWQVPISAPSKRAVVLRELNFKDNLLTISIEDEHDKKWELRVRNLQAWRVTAEEVAAPILSMLPDEGAFFILDGSDWIQQMSTGRLVENSKHYVISCYDEIVEILAQEEIKVKELGVSR